MKDPSRSDPRRVILIVDDSPEICIVVAHGLERYGYRVFSANDAKSAFTAISEQALDLIIIDHKLACGDGIELGSQIRQRLGHLPPLVLFTGTDDKELARRAMTAGFSEYWLKPMGLHLLRKKVDAILN
jgi:CheY-like chemotaxis protein